MEIAAIPARSLSQGLPRERRVFCPRIEVYLRRLVCNHLGTHVRNSDDEPPDSSRNLPRKVGRRCIGFANGEMAFVAATFSTKAMGVCDADIQGGTLVSSSVLKVDADTVYARRHGEWDVKVRLVLRSLDVAREYQTLLRNAPGGKRKKDKAESPAPHDVQASSSTESF
jgi:hypothetical protein